MHEYVQNFINEKQTKTNNRGFPLTFSIFFLKFPYVGLFKNYAFLEKSF